MTCKAPTDVVASAVVEPGDRDSVVAASAGIPVFGSVAMTDDENDFGGLAVTDDEDDGISELARILCAVVDAAITGFVLAVIGFLAWVTW